MRKLKPRNYIEEFYPDSGISVATVKNWIKSGKIKGEQTPTGRYLVCVPIGAQSSQTDELLQFLEA